MTNVGVIGLGMMGATHLDAYAKHPGARVVAVAERNEDLRHGRRRAAGNIEGQAQGNAQLDAARKYAEGMELIEDPDVDLVDICLPTPLHLEYAAAALKAGKHLLVEKPLARTAADAFALADLAAQAPGVAMPAMCMRFWPGWDWLKEAVDDRRFGRVLAAHFRRVSSHPQGRFYADGDASGGALLDLHIHDTDFVQYCFGTPDAVFSRGYSHITSATDHVATHYLYKDGPMVTAEGGWAMTAGFPFTMQYTVNFEQATAAFDIAADPKLRVTRGGRTEAVELPGTMGYEHEIGYVLRCIAANEKPKRVTLRDAAASVAITEFELASIRSGAPEPVRLPAAR